MAEPKSAKTRPSAIASKAPTRQAISDCGPPMVAMIAGTVMNGPVPTMFDMLIETALSSPKRRTYGRRDAPWPWRVWLDWSIVIPAFRYGQPEYCNRQIEASTLSGSKRLALPFRHPPGTLRKVPKYSNWRLGNKTNISALALLPFNPCFTMPMYSNV
jgi:hypothetical protein